MFRLPALLAVLACLAHDPTKVGFNQLAGFDYKEGMTLPKEVTDLDEVTVEIKGFMQREVPGGGPVNQFMLVNNACGCNGMPKMNEIVFCTLPDGVTMDIKPGIVTVTGKLYVGEEKEDGVVVLIYQMDADTVQ
ncbi:MAG TPA: DUF3299 domain-containing protein [Planctomycetota bacterium]|nr:DUF3299 domain-containing protein [Planctomycetota bacterium]